MAMHRVVWPAIIPGGCYYNYESRPNWERSIHGRLALVGSIVGYGSVVYFPYHFMKYKIVYLFPFLTILILVGIPLFTFELAMGQYLNIGPIKGFSSLAPILSGVGWGMMMTSLITSIFYNLYLAYSAILFVKYVAYFVGYSENEDTLSNICSLQFSKSQVTSNSEFNGELLVFFMASWLIVAICLSKGYQSSSRMIVFINVLPFYLLLILVILKAHFSGTGIPVLSMPHDFWKHVLNWPIWLDAFKQILFTLGIGFGVTSTLASYNKAAKHKFLLDVIAIPLIDFATSLLCLYLIYENLHPPEGESVLFTLCTFAEKMQEDQVNVFIYLIFFLMGLSCQLSIVETVVIAILDQYKKLRNYHFYVVMIICFILAISGSYTCVNTDLYLALRSTGENLLTFFALLLALSAPIFCLRFNQIKQDLNLEISKIFESYLKLCWCFFCPLILTFGTITNFIMNKESLHSANIVSAVLVFFSLSFSVCKIWKLKIKEYFQPTNDFCLFEKRSRPPSIRNIPSGEFRVHVPP